MAVIKYQINGKADTKPITQTATAATGLFKKVEAIDNKLKAFVGVKVFASVTKAINNSIKEYDAFKKSIGDESAFTKQINSLKTSLSGSLGVIRDSLTSNIGELINDITGGTTSAIDALKETTPKVAASLIAGFKVASTIVANIVKNFDTIFNPENWNDFFNHAKSLAHNFGLFFVNILKDVFSYGADFFRYALEKINIFELLWTPFKLIFSNIFKALGKETPEWLEPMTEALRGFGGFSFSAETTNALSEFNKELKATLKEGLNTLAGEDASALYNSSYNSNLEKINGTINAMTAAANNNTDELEKLTKALKDAQNKAIKESLSSATSKYNASTSNVNSILGNATNKSSERIRNSMVKLNTQFQNTTKNIDLMRNRLAETTDENETTNLTKNINTAINKIQTLSKAMNSLEKPAARARISFDLLEGVLGAIGELGIVIQSILTNNVIGLIIIGISKLIETFSKLENGGNKVTGVMDIITSLFNVIGEIIAGLGPIISVILTPILGAVTALGRVLGSLLNILVPLLAVALQPILMVFKALAPILNFVAGILSIAADGFGTLYNAISKVIKGITFGLVNIGSMATDNYKRFKDSLNQENLWESNENTNNSTSYNIAGDMYINIYYEHSYVNGDAREIALNLRNEIRMAEAAGY
jgi:phage-related protein